ncbi:MAG TPA: RNA-binding protein [Candidatus Acidoferrales bacterium]|nr:RNA-binding protein [Candidatus Acidoferrales bacterium]
MSQARLFVGNLSFQTGENDLQDYFAQAGAVTSVNLMLDKMTGRSRGFAFVEYATPEEAQKAIEQFHDKDFQGRKITVNVARPREERAPRSGGFSGGGERRSDRGERRERY